MTFSHSYQQLDPTQYVEAFKDPLWYLKLEQPLLEYFWGYTGEDHARRSPEWHATRREWVVMVSEFLDQGLIILGSFGENWDRDRKPIDTIVIHHSSTEPNTSVSYLDAISLLRLHSFYCLKVGEPEYHRPVWSNHFYQGRQTFIPYHYLVRRDGSVEQLLEDGHVGWHAGKSVNGRSVAICFVDDLENARPSEQALSAAKQIIAQYQPERLVGHGEVHAGRTCPGGLFFGEGGWKQQLLAQ